MMMHMRRFVSVAVAAVALLGPTQPVAAHDDYLPLAQPQLIESECVQRWRSMTKSFQNSTLKRSRPWMVEAEPSELNVTLAVRFDRFESRYVGFNTRSYNGAIPAPTIAVCPGDRLVLRVVNELGEGAANVTNVHMHGLRFCEQHVSPKGHADNILRNIEPGEALLYEYEIRPDHPAGSFWYHPHSHGLVNAHLNGMMAGMLVVVDRPGDLPSEIDAMEDLVLILQGICVENCHTQYDCIVNALKNQYDSGEDDEEDDEAFPVDLRVDANSPLNDTSLLHVYVNGQYLPEIHMRLTEFKRLRFLNAIANNVAELVAPGCELHVLSMDGIYFDSPVRKPVVVIPPGGRADVAVTCSTSGTFFVKTEASPTRNHLLGKVNHHRAPTQNIVSLRVLEEDSVVAMAVPSTLPRRPEYMQDTALLASSSAVAVPETNRYNYEFSVWQDPDQGTRYGVNQRSFEHKFINYSMVVDELQEWELSVRDYGPPCDESAHTPVPRAGIDFGTEMAEHTEAPMAMGGMKAMVMPDGSCHTMNHPFHMHSAHFQITGFDTTLDPENLLFARGEWRDTIPLFKSNVQIRFTPRDHMIGRVLTHCHVASHSDGGMAQMVRVLASPEDATSGQ